MRSSIRARSANTDTYHGRFVILAVHDGLPRGLSTADSEVGWRSSLANLAALVERVSADEDHGDWRMSMTEFQSMWLPVAPDVVAPDGSDVRILLGLTGAGMAHFELAPGQTSIAVTHRTVEEIWFFLGGRGEMWRKQGDREEIVAVESGVCLTIPLGTRFQFRAFGDEPLRALGVTMPPWPGDDEAIVVAGTWEPTVPRG